MRIYLIGMPASGKTTLGKQLAAALQYTFIDMDAVIEQKTGQRIPSIFEQHGEAHFRKLEQATLLAIQGTDAVISTGGGAPCFFDNMSVIEQMGTSIFLDVSPETLMERAAQQAGTRPLLAEKEGKELLNALIEKRKLRLPYYQRATITLNENEIQLPHILKQLNLN